MACLLLCGWAMSLFGMLAGRNAEAEGDDMPVAPVAAVSVAEGDNSYCLVCHINYKEEKFARAHQKAGMNCMQCHGSSNDHSSDENNITPPDIMYPKQNVDPLCVVCHSLAGHEPLVNEPGKQYCTDCHAKDHILKVRTRRWDKVTRKLIADDNVRMGSGPAPK
jgi:hypothetical protein